MPHLSCPPSLLAYVASMATAATLGAQNPPQPPSPHGQSNGGATLRGAVTTVPGGAPVGGVDVWVVGADRHAQTDSAGTFSIADLPAGAQIVQLKRIGYDVQRATVTLVAGAETVQRYTMATRVAMLDTMTTLAGKQKYISPMSRGFEDRRSAHAGGYFISDSIMRQSEHSTLLNVVLAHFPSITRNQQRALVSTRKSCRGPAFLPSKDCQNHIPDCYVSIYIDGTLLFQAQMREQGVPLPDLSRYSTVDYAGAEFYPGGASAPVGMSPNDDGCGTLWLWTREK
jgi:hypothetical protein